MEGQNVIIPENSLSNWTIINRVKLRGFKNKTCLTEHQPVFKNKRLWHLLILIPPQLVSMKNLVTVWRGLTRDVRWKPYKSDENRDPAVCSCRHSKSSVWVRNVCCVQQLWAHGPQGVRDACEDWRRGKWIKCLSSLSCCLRVTKPPKSIATWRFSTVKCARLSRTCTNSINMLYKL